MVESVLPTFYLPGYGLRGVPLFLLANPDDVPRERLLRAERRAERGRSTTSWRASSTSDVAVSPPVADFWRLDPGTPILLGLDAERRATGSNTAGILAFLPGIPPKSVSDRQGYVQARIDYLNYLFSTNAYLATGIDNPKLKPLQILLPRVIVLLKADPAVDPVAFPKAIAKRERLSAARDPQPDAGGRQGRQRHVHLAGAGQHADLPDRRPDPGARRDPRDRDGELQRGSPHARRCCASAALRRRRCGGSSLAMLLSPALVGLALGATSAVLAGFGLANYVWKLREIRTVVQLLPTHLVVSVLTAWIALLLIFLLVGVASGFSWWVYRHTAHRSMQGA